MKSTWQVRNCYEELGTAVGALGRALTYSKLVSVRSEFTAGSFAKIGSCIIAAPRNLDRLS